jgi:hypothetical protein
VQRAPFAQRRSTLVVLAIDQRAVGQALACGAARGRAADRDAARIEHRIAGVPIRERGAKLRIEVGSELEHGFSCGSLGASVLAAFPGQR